MPIGDDLARMRTEKMVLSAQWANLRLRRRRGELIPRRFAESVGFVIGNRVRDALMMAPARHAAELAAENGLDARLLVLALEAAMRNVLVELSGNGKAKL